MFVCTSICIIFVEVVVVPLMMADGPGVLPVRHYAAIQCHIQLPLKFF